MGQLDSVAAKGIGDDDVGAGVDVIPMDAADNIRKGQVEFFGRLARRQAALLKQRSHCAVQNEHPLADCLDEGFPHM